jgi:hypothetical protein
MAEKNQNQNQNQNETVIPEKRTITAYQGRLFTVTLKSGFGSTNIGWCLTGLPSGIALLSEENIRLSSRIGGSVNQVFYFVAIAIKDVKDVKDVKKVRLEFSLITHLPTIGEQQVVGTVSVDVEVYPYDETSDIGKTRFVDYSENGALVGAASGEDSDCTRVLKYGYPPFLKYGYPVEDAPLSQMVRPYGYPDGAAAPCPLVTDSDGSARYKYGYPVNTAFKYGYPPIEPPCPLVTEADGSARYKYGYAANAGVKYGYPAPNAPAACDIVQDDCGCSVVKYGYPSAPKYGYPPVNATPACDIVQDDCGRPVVKYGYPPCPLVTDADGSARYKYGYAANAGFKYGYPPPNVPAACDVVQDDCGCHVVKYGYPPMLKYGYPGCR